MKRHHFPLRSVGVIRAHRLWLARQGLAQSIQAADGVRDRLVAKRRRIEFLTAQQATARSGHFRAADEAAFWGHQRREAAEVIQLERQVAQAEADVAAKRAACIEADRAVKMIERLEATALAAHRVESLRALQGELDEFAGHRARMAPRFHD
jgi:flagellar export protein FliJ